MSLVEQYFAPPEDGEYGVHLIQVWSSALQPGQSFCVMRKVLQLSDQVVSFKVKKLGSADNLITCYRTPPSIKERYKSAKRRRLMDGAR